MKRHSDSGFTLVELLIAILIGSILLLGIATLFTNTTNNIRLQRGIANVQENGRLVSEFLKQDLAYTSSLYCATLSMEPSVSGFTPRRPIFNQIPVGGTNGNDDRLSVYTTTATGVSGGTFYGLPGLLDHPMPSPVAPNDERVANYIAARFNIQGHNCVGSICTPLLTVLGAGRTETGQTAAPTDVGLDIGNRVPNSDVLTVRVLTGSGASITGPSPSGNGFTLAPQSDIRTRLNTTPSGRHSDRLVMVSDCNKAVIYRGSFNFTDNTLEVPVPLGIGADFPIANNPRVFDMENQWLTITYYLQYVADPNTAGRVIPALMRRENGRNPEELARGVERLDFRYSVAINNSAANETSRWLDAAQVQSRDGATIPCPVVDTSGFGVLDGYGSWDPTGSCLWTSVRAIEVGFAATSVDPLAFSDDRINYVMENEQNIPTNDRMLHREFRVLIPLKSWSK